MKPRTGCILAVLVIAAVIGGAQWYWDRLVYGNATPLHRAVLHNDLPRVQALLAKGADPNSRMSAPLRHGSEGSTALHLAARLRNPGIVTALLAAGAEKNAVNRAGQTALHVALQFQDEPAALELIRAGADVHAVWNYQTPILLALQSASMPIVQELVDAGADPAQEIDQDAMRCADAPDLLPKLQLLHHLGLRVPGSPWSGSTPLHTAARCNDPAAIAFLLDHGAHLEATDSNGTPLLSASLAGADDAIRALLARGANPKAGSEYYGSPLYAAAFGGNTETVRLLLSLNLGINLQAGRASDRATPLHFAYWNHDQTMVKLLLDAGADPNARTTDGRLPSEFGR